MNSGAVFSEAINDAKHLQLKVGLKALKPKEGKSRIHLGKGVVALGSVAIDDDCKSAHPNDTRWDYVVGVNRASKPLAHYIEVHSACTNEVSKMAEKLEWLKQYIRAQAKLSLIKSEFHWVASERVKRSEEHTSELQSH